MSGDVTRRSTPAAQVSTEGTQHLFKSLNHQVRWWWLKEEKGYWTWVNMWGFIYVRGVFA